MKTEPDLRFTIYDLRFGKSLRRSVWSPGFSRSGLTSLLALLSSFFLLPSSFAAVGGVSGGVNLSGVGRATVTNIVNALAGAGSGQIATQVVNQVTFVNNAFFNTNVYFQSNVFFNGKVTLTNVVHIHQLSFATNHAAVGVLNLNCTDQAFTTNNNVAYTGFSIPDAYGVTNSAWCSVLVTNTSGSLKTITFAGCIGDTTGYVTNQSAFTVKKYPGMGTNVVFRPLN